MIFDTHAHYDDEQFNEDRHELLTGMKEHGVGLIVNASAEVASWERTIALTQKYPFIYGTIGVHPDDVGDLNEQNFERMERLLSTDKIVAVGEIGLDYYWDNQPHDIQKQWFIRQLNLSREHNLPVVIHSREAAEDTLRIMKEYASDLPAILHCFSYSRELAREYVKMGYFIGVGGVVTFKNGRKLKEVVVDTPIEHLLLETDCPYLAPVPNRGKRNSSANLIYVAEEIARLKDMTAEEVIRITEINAKKIYNL
ncbi:MAG: TatD family hydrolase [Lachnospiraceae bacterium]